MISLVQQTFFLSSKYVICQLQPKVLHFWVSTYGPFKRNEMIHESFNSFKLDNPRLLYAPLSSEYLIFPIELPLDLFSLKQYN